MTSPDEPAARPRRLRDRIHALSVAAFHAIPFVGGQVADFYEKHITPRVTGPRDVVFDFFARCFLRKEKRGS